MLDLSAGNERVPGDEAGSDDRRCAPVGKLGIAVVYLVDETDGPLLDLHLRYVQEHTTSPYTIYASVNRLLPPFRGVLEERPEVRIVEVPTTDLRGAHEHSYYLEHLIPSAVEDGCTHVAILHVDSFPIRHGWEREFTAQLTADSPLTAIVEHPKANRRPCTAGMLFTREFYLHHQPRLMLTENERNSRSYRRYALREPHCADSGVGYGLKLYTEGLGWRPLLPANPEVRAIGWGQVYGGLIFHLGAAARKPTHKNRNLPGLRRVQTWLKAAVFPRVPRFVRPLLRPLKKPVLRQRIPPGVLEGAKRKLYEDPERYIERVRDGR